MSVIYPLTAARSFMLDPQRLVLHFMLVMCPNMSKHQFFVLSTEDTPTSIDISIPDDLYSVVMGRHVSEDPAKDHRVWWSGVSKQFDAG